MGRGSKHVPVGGGVITGIFSVGSVPHSTGLGSPTAAKLSSTWFLFPCFGQNPSAQDETVERTWRGLVCFRVPFCSVKHCSVLENSLLLSIILF